MSNPRADLEKVLDYARKRGLNVKILNYVKGSGDAGELDLLNSEMRIFKTKRQSIRAQVATILHELCHFENYQLFPETYIPYFIASEIKKPNKEQRYAIYSIEKRDISNMLMLYDVLGLSGIPRAYIALQQEYDIWVYAHWYFKGKRTILQQRKDKLAKLRAKHGVR